MLPIQSLYPSLSLSLYEGNYAVSLSRKKLRMSFLAGRLAGKEGAYFFQESKHAVARLIEKTSSKTLSPGAPAQLIGNEADILPEVLRHSLPPEIFRPPPPSSLSTASKWSVHSSDQNTRIISSVLPDDLNPLRGSVALPQVTLGPKRWQFPYAENSVVASTANELRQDKYTPVNPEKLKASAAGILQIGKAFAIATGIVFGGASLAFGLAASKLDIHSTDDIRTKGKDLLRPKFDTVREQLIPLRTWAEGKSKKWHLGTEDDIKELPLVKELSKILGVKTSN